MTGTLAAAATTLAQNPLWFTSRSTGLVAFVLLTGAVVLGLLTTRRAATERWPRFAAQSLHRNVSLLAVAFLVVHVASTLLDSFVSIGWWSVVVPFTSSYRTLGVALGTLAVDVLLVVVTTSLVRAATGHRWWRLVHWTAYAAWPLALGHYLLTGTDAGRPWSLGLSLVCLAGVLAALAGRLRGGLPAGPRPVGAAR